MATVYITASERWKALFWKKIIEAGGHVVTSTWHDEPMVRTGEWKIPDKVAEADSTSDLIKNSDFLLIVDDPDKVPGGKFVDAGIMIGNEGRVILVGRYENLKMYNSQVIQANDVNDVRRILCNAEYTVSTPEE